VAGDHFIILSSACVDHHRRRRGELNGETTARGYATKRPVPA